MGEGVIEDTVAHIVFSWGQGTTENGPVLVVFSP